MADDDYDDDATILLIQYEETRRRIENDIIKFHLFFLFHIKRSFPSISLRKENLGKEGKTLARLCT